MKFVMTLVALALVMFLNAGGPQARQKTKDQKSGSPLSESSDGRDRQEVKKCKRI